MKEKKLHQKITKKKKQARERKRFVRWSILVSTVLMLGIAIPFFYYLAHQEQWLLQDVNRAILQGDLEKARVLADRLPEGQERNQVQLEIRYHEAELLASNKQFEQAEAIFNSLGDFADSVEQGKYCRYLLAEELLQSGSIAQAQEIFYSLAGYGDAMDRYDACRYQEAVQLEQQGALSEAFYAYRALGTYHDASERSQAVAVELTGRTDPQEAVKYALGYTEETMDAMVTLEEERGNLPGQVLAVGCFHTVGVQRDGTVLAAGRNEEGQCNVDSWQDVIAVSAGAFHTVALHRDGTVSATGRNQEGQCDVESWKGIKAIACSAYGTFGLKNDGTVVGCGFQMTDSLSGWKDIIAIGAGEYLYTAVRNGGTLIASHPAGLGMEGEQLVNVDCSTGYSLGLTEQGKVISSIQGEVYRDCIAICAASTGYMALTREHKVLTHFFEKRNDYGIPALEDVYAFAMGATHAAFLMGNGSAIALGDNEYGQCNVEGWLLAPVK